MNREQERQLLREQNKHYLWNKPRDKWTREDLENLKNGVTINQKTFKGDKDPSKIRVGRSFKQMVTVIDQLGLEKKYESALEAAESTGVKPYIVYSRINGITKNSGEYQFFKSKINS